MMKVISDTPDPTRQPIMTELDQPKLLSVEFALCNAYMRRIVPAKKRMEPGTSICFHLPLMDLSASGDRMAGATINAETTAAGTLKIKREIRMRISTGTRHSALGDPYLSRKTHLHVEC
jgi:hypothetical protein